MKKVAFAICLAIAAALGAIAGSDRTGRDHAWGEVSVAADDLARSGELRDEVERLRTRFDEVRGELAAATTPDAATAARAALFQLRVDMVTVEDEIAVLARRTRVAR
jgi:hypothetical protein